MTEIIVTACLAGAALTGLLILAVFRGGRLVEEREESDAGLAVAFGEPAMPSPCKARYIRPGGGLPGDRIVECHLIAGHPGNHEEADTLVTWAEPSPDDTIQLNRHGTRPGDFDCCLPDWARTEPVEVPVVVPVADQAVVLTTIGRKRGRHAAGYVEFVDPDWYNAQLGCAQYPRREMTLR